MSRGVMMKSAILSLSMLTIMASAAVSPALARIGQAFPGAESTVIKLVLTLPSLLFIPFSLLSGWLVSRLSKKKILVTGLLIYFVAGVGGGAARTIGELLAVRAVFGIGIGLIMPLSTTLIADFFQGEARARMMGLSGSATNLGGVIFLSLSGWLACFSWRYSFAVYALSLVTLLMILLWLPEPPKSTARSAGGGPSPRLPGNLYFLAVCGALLMITFYAVPTNLALFIESEKHLFSSEVPLFQSKEDFLHSLEEGRITEYTSLAFRQRGIGISPAASLREEVPGQRWVISEKGKDYTVLKSGGELEIWGERIGRPAIAGYALSAMTLSGVLAGIILAWAVRVFRSYSGALFLALMAAGFFILGRANSTTEIFLAVPFIGISGGFLMQYLLLRVAEKTPPARRAFAMAVVSSAVFFGQFLSPLALKEVTLVTGNDTFRFRFTFLAVSLIAAAVIGVVKDRIPVKAVPE